jgi:chemotaxis protein MotB
MFRLGSDEPTEKAIQIIRLVSENIREKPNRIVIEGHTDAAPFKTAQKTNWELSTSRASAARRELENYGIDPGRIARVVGYADQELLVREDPKDPRNRRISIILLR